MGEGDEQRRESDAIDREFGQAVAGRIQFATVDQLGRLADTLRDMKATLNDIREDQKRMSVETAEMRGWLEGTTSPEGDTKPGALAKLQTLSDRFDSAWSRITTFMWVVGAGVCTTAIAAVVNAFINFINATAKVTH